MPRTELPSGAWVEWRDSLVVQDRFAVNAALTFVFEPRPDGSEARTASGGTDDQMRVALLGRLITAWSFPGIPVPAQNTASAGEVIGQVLDLDDYQALVDATGAVFQKVLRSPKVKPPES